MNEKLLDDFVGRLRDALGGNLVSVVLYGSAVTGDFQETRSDLNVLCVLERVDVAALDQAGAAIDWWMNKKQPAPVLLSVEEIQNAHDAFAIEFLDIRAAYRILHGKDLIEAIDVGPAHHRHQVEHELRSRLVRLRERYLALQNDRREVARLMTDSVSTFATLFRHVLLLSGTEAPLKKREVFLAASARLGVASTPFETLLDVRENHRRLTDAEVRSVFEEYLRQITKAAEHIDRL
jgi:predicted nucleotidyltransferase